MQKQQTTGTTAALAGGVTGYLITILMYLAKHFGIDDMDISVATAFVSTAMFVAGGVSHFFDRRNSTNETTVPGGGTGSGA